MVIYAISGGGWSLFSTVRAYDPATNTWTKKADLPTARGGHSSVAVNGKIYVIGGGGEYVGDTPTEKVEEYDQFRAPRRPQDSAKGNLVTVWARLKEKARK